MRSILYRFDEAFDSQNWDEVLRLKDEAYKVIKETKSVPRKAVFFVNLGITYRNLGDYHRAMTCQTEALGLYRRLWDLSGMGYCYMNIGNVHCKLGDCRKGLEYYKTAMKFATESGNNDLLYLCTRNKAVAEHWLGVR